MDQQKIHRKLRVKFMVNEFFRRLEGPFQFRGIIYERTTGDEERISRIVLTLILLLNIGMNYNGRKDFLFETP